MGWWKADQVSTPSIHPPASPSLDQPASSCPVDPKTRAIWLQQARSESRSQSHTLPVPDSHLPIPSNAANAFATSPSSQCSSYAITKHPPPPATRNSPLPKGFRPLSHDRVISSIPRANPHASPSTPILAAAPSNSESETGSDATTGHWIYPSEHQFFTAVLRKNSLPTSSPDPSSLASTVPAIIPIHNAVNERAWALIKQWEGDSSARCGGPKPGRRSRRGARAPGRIGRICKTV